jgi:hypothetical protein
VQIVALFLGVGMLGIGTLSAQPQQLKSSARPERIFNQKHGFSVIRPRGWFLFDGELPSFFNFPAERMLPQGEFPQGGAAILMLATEETNRRDGDASLRAWADQRIQMHNGVGVEIGRTPGPPGIGVSEAIQASFDQLALGQPGQSRHIVLVAWRLGQTLFGAELSFIKNDPHANQYQSIVRDLVRSFSAAPPSPTAIVVR